MTLTKIDSPCLQLQKCLVKSNVFKGPVLLIGKCLV